MAQLGDLTLENGQTLGDLTPRIGQPLNEKTLAYIMLGVNAANQAYNIGLPSSAYTEPGAIPVGEGASLTAQRDQAFVGGIDQPYASAPGFFWEKTQTDPGNGFKAGLLVNRDMGIAVIAVAGMDGIEGNSGDTLLNY